MSLIATQDISSEKSRSSLELTDRIVHKSAVRVLMHRNNVIIIIAKSYNDFRILALTPVTVIHSADLSLQLRFMMYICILYPLPLTENVIVRSSEKVHLPNSEPRI